MATLVSDIIDAAFGDLGLMPYSVTVNSVVQADAFNRLNLLWAAWSADETISNGQYNQSLTPTAGTSAYTFGTAGTLVASAPPIRVYGAQSVSGGFRNPVKIVSFEEFDILAADVTSSQSVLASILACDNAQPNINLRVFPVPATAPGNLMLDYLGFMTPFATVSTDISFLTSPFLEALHFNLAMSLLPRYGGKATDTQALVANAASSVTRIQNLNKLILGGSPSILGGAPAPSAKPTQPAK